MKQKGAQVFVYIDLLSDSSPIEKEAEFLWGVLQQDLESQWSQIHEVVKVGGLAPLRSYSSRAEMVQRGQEAGRKLVQTLQMKYGFLVIVCLTVGERCLNEKNFGKPELVF